MKTGSLQALSGVLFFIGVWILYDHRSMIPDFVGNQDIILAENTSKLLWLARSALTGALYETLNPSPDYYRNRVTGSDWPSIGLTMTGMIRLENFENCIRDV